MSKLTERGPRPQSTTTALVAGHGEKKEKGFYLPALDGLRFIAFFMVFLRHGLPRVEPTSTIRLWYDTVIQAGAYGVPLFFALSAYLITTLLLKEKARTNDISVPAFYLRRILRIWPLFYFMLFLGLGVNALFGYLAAQHPGANPPWDFAPVSGWMIFRFATFNANFACAGGAIYPISIGILWSVCVEEQFYLTWPWVNKFFNKRGLGIIAVLMILTGIAFRVSCVLRGLGPESVWFSAFSNLDCFGFGTLAALYGGWVKPKPLLRTILIVGGFLGILLTARYCSVFDLRPTITVLHLPMRSAPGFTITAFLAAFIVLLIGNSDQKMLLAKRPWNSLGQISYGLYVYHALVLTVMPHLMPTGTRVEKIVGLFVTIGVASLSYRFLEQPFLRLRHKFQIVKSGSLN